MGLFSIFKGKKDEPEDPSDGTGEPSRLDYTDAERARQREIAKATAAKIDAIEEAMISDIFNDEQPWGAKRRARPEPAAESLDVATTELLHEDERPDAAVAAESAPVIEEVAIMYANGQAQVCKAMLAESLAGPNALDRSVWWMLFDLYHATGQQEAFDSLAIDYASRFETSPPTWSAPATDSQAGLAANQTFTGVLDAAIAPQLDRLVTMAASSSALRLEFARVSDVTGEGATLLLAALKKLRKQDRPLIVAGAFDLAALLRSMVEVGKRDTDPALWLLLLEMLQFLDREKEFEETAMDYCVTYEVSPPSFEKPRHVEAATAERGAHMERSDRYMLPALMEGESSHLLDEIDVYISQYDTAVLDFSRLLRIDYTAASALLNRLRPLAAAGRKIEFRDMNHLVAALFRLQGFGDIVKLYPHKY